MWRQSLSSICDQTICLIFVKSSVKLLSNNWQADTSLMKISSVTAILYLKVSEFPTLCSIFLGQLGAIW
jgi:hypothetical protein